MGKAFARSVGQDGYQVISAGTAEEALKLSHEQPFKVVVTDLRMPGMDGLTLTERLYEVHPQTVFLVVTGMPDLDLHRDSQRGAAVLATFAKPWDDSEMLETIGRAFQLYDRRVASHDQDERNQLSVLLIEDSPADAFLTERLLRKACAGHVEQVFRVAEAEVLLESNSYDVVFTDLSLPDARGIDAVRRIRRAAAGIALIVLSGLEDEAVVGQALRYGAQEFLAKGQFSAMELGHRVRLAMERAAYIQELSRMAHFDPLTGLANRRTLREQFRRSQGVARHNKTQLGFLSIDLDRFKVINDTMGHEAGDNLLQGVAARIKEVVRENDVVARLGGDEFAVLLTGLEQGELTAIAECLVGRMAAPYQLEEGTIGVTASVGAMEITSEIADFDTILRASDEAMYQAKRGGRNQLVAVQQRAPQKEVGSALETALVRAATGDGFRLFYQPQFCLRSRRLTGFEAFLRFEHEGNPVPPRVFVPLLENMGLIDSVGGWALDTACAELQRCLNAGADPDLRMAVNLSEKQFENPQLAERVSQALEKATLPASALDLEITEALLMGDTEQTAASLTALRSLGVRVTIDDFGTGYSSLAFLQRFDICALKIDPSFVRQLHEERMTYIAEAIIDLGHRLELDIVAMGVETAAQLDQLAKQGCDKGQGFYLGAPRANAMDCAAAVLAS